MTKDLVKHVVGPSTQEPIKKLKKGFSAKLAELRRLAGPQAWRTCQLLEDKSISREQIHRFGEHYPREAN